MTRSVRKPHWHGGTQVRICGRKIDGGNDLICTLPPKHIGSNHLATAITPTGDLVAVVQTDDGRQDAWRLVGPDE